MLALLLQPGRRRLLQCAAGAVQVARLACAEGQVLVLYGAQQALQEARHVQAGMNAATQRVDHVGQGHGWPWRPQAIFHWPQQARRQLPGEEGAGSQRLQGRRGQAAMGWQCLQHGIL